MYYVYILECADGTLYTGSTPDIPKRLNLHNSGKGAKYTRGRLPVKLVYQEECTDKSAALKREIAIQKLRRDAKERLIANKEPLKQDNNA